MDCRPFLLEGFSPVDHLAAEACLLGSAQAEESFLLFYIDAPSVIFGRNQNPWREVASGFLDRAYRRISGGGAVYHDEGNLNWALIVPRRSHDQGRELGWIAAAVSALGRKVEPGPRGGLYLAEGDEAGAKVSGTARRFGQRAVLHHGTLLLCSDLEALTSSLGGIETTEDRALPSVGAGVANLTLPRRGIPPREAAEALSRLLCGKAPSHLTPLALDGEAFERERAKLESEEWRFGATPPFSVELGGLGEGKAILSVVDGRVTGLEAQVALCPEDGARLLGFPFSLALLAEARAVLGQ